MNYLIIILLVQALLFGLLFSKKMKSKHVFWINWVFFFLLFGKPLIVFLLNAMTDEDFYSEYFHYGFGLLFCFFWSISFIVLCLVTPFLISHLPIGLHESIFYKKTNSKY